LNSYDCYFDGSHKPEISGCAFIIEADGEIVYSQVSPAQLKSSHRAERLALHLLLQYIGESISLGSTIRIFGDAKWMIDVINHETSGSKGHKTRALLHKLRQNHDISLAYIPRRDNRVAHRLARTITRPSTIPLQPKRYDFTNSKIMSLDDIIIPAHMLKNLPKKSKYQKRKAFFLMNGELYKPIHVDVDDALVDGYISYLILKEVGIQGSLVIVKL